MFDPHHLLPEELDYELNLRDIVNYQNTRRNKARLLAERVAEDAQRGILHHAPPADLERDMADAGLSIRAIRAELNAGVNESTAFDGLRSRLMHLQGRTGRMQGDGTNFGDIIDMRASVQQMLDELFDHIRRREGTRHRSNPTLPNIGQLGGRPPNRSVEVERSQLHQAGPLQPRNFHIRLQNLPLPQGFLHSTGVNAAAVGNAIEPARLSGVSNDDNARAEPRAGPVMHSLRAPRVEEPMVSPILIPEARDRRAAPSPPPEIENGRPREQAVPAEPIGEQAGVEQINNVEQNAPRIQRENVQVPLLQRRRMSLPEERNALDQAENAQRRPFQRNIPPIFVFPEASNRNDRPVTRPIVPEASRPRGPAAPAVPLFPGLRHLIDFEPRRVNSTSADRNGTADEEPQREIVRRQAP